ncbi:MAG TPA: dienelactone hydrolase family protein [Stellaceae bacterium]|nr:dienelactone hydrolase family protein [Stellaceae bacterium]
MVAAARADAGGFQYGSAADGDNPALELAIWYPSDAPVATKPVGLFEQQVAYYGPVKGDALPLVVISHGTGGSAAEHYDTALALAEAGFVVVAINHTGDNYKDRGVSFTQRNFTDRSRHVSRVIDFMLNGWKDHSHLDPGKIGIVGHSGGGATSLIAIGGIPNFALGPKFCAEHPETWDCQRVEENNAADAPGDSPATQVSEGVHDSRLKAAVIAAPAIGYVFEKDALSGVTAPVQLWRAENDKVTPNQWNADLVRDALPVPPEDHLVANAGHFDFLAPCSDALAKVASEICESAPDFDRAAFHQDFDKAIVAFFKAQLMQ